MPSSKTDDDDDNNKEPGPEPFSSLVDAVELHASLGFWLRTISKITISVALPVLKVPNSCIGTWQVSEKLKKRIRPNFFKNLKVVRTSLELIRFEAELPSKSALENVISILDRSTIKLSGFVDSLKVRACKLKLGSTRPEWEAYFRENSEMDEMKPGLRPDTVHIEGLPIKWFGGDQPSIPLILQVFSVFGEIRRFHVPHLDQTAGLEEAKVENGFKRFNFNEILTFDVYIMYRDYIGFVRAMETLTAKKLIKKIDEREKYIEYDINVDFDRTKHLSEKMIKFRQGERKKAQEKNSIEENKKNRKSQENSPQDVKESKDKVSSSKYSVEARTVSKRHVEEISASDVKDNKKSSTSKKTDNLLKKYPKDKKLRKKRTHDHDDSPKSRPSKRSKKSVKKSSKECRKHHRRKESGCKSSKKSEPHKPKTDRSSHESIKNHSLDDLKEDTNGTEGTENARKLLIEQEAMLRAKLLERLEAQKKAELLKKSELFDLVPCDSKESHSGPCSSVIPDSRLRSLVIPVNRS
ncbi:A-kinase anchor protein 17A [Brevipalpus obovatus]|uniref:A-kinase anchor protein 17A n=1 Tax=Brevipalpus obovatus TaxID=246614 RepID=UPI003D9E7B53